MLSDLKTGSGVGADIRQTCLEVGCGSGAISLSLLKSLPQVRNGHVPQTDSQNAVQLMWRPPAGKAVTAACVQGSQRGLGVMFLGYWLRMLTFYSVDI